MDRPEYYVAALSILTIFGLPVAAFVVFRILAHRERMAMIRNGIAPGKRGVPYMAGNPKAGGYDADDPRVLLRKGIRLTFIGLALSIGLSFIGFSDDGPWHLGPWMLGGLIPLFIGLAQIATAYVSDPSILAQFLVSRRAGQPPYPGAANPQPQPRYGRNPSNGSSDFEGPYTYRPDGTQELRRPTPPPERRS